MGRLENNTASLSWGAEADYTKVQTSATQGLAGAIGETVTVTSGGFLGIGATTSAKNTIDQLFSASTGGGTDLAGLDETKIKSTVIPALEEYVKEIETAINGLENADAERQAAIKGEISTAVGTFISAAKDHLFDIVSHLKKFEGRILEVAENYKTASENIASDISSQAAQVGDAVDRFN